MECFVKETAKNESYESYELWLYPYRSNYCELCGCLCKGKIIFDFKDFIKAFSTNCSNRPVRENFIDCLMTAARSFICGYLFLPLQCVLGY